MKKLRLLLITMFIFLLVDFSFAQTEKYMANNETEIKKDVNSSQVIATVPKGTELEIIEKDGSWWNVTCEYNGKTIEGWINESQTVYEAVQEQGAILTPKQEEYLKAYTHAYIAEARRMNIYLYDGGNLDGYHNSYDMKLSYGKKNDIAPYSNKLVNVCSSFVADLLHQALGAPLRGETVNGVTYNPTPIRGTGFCNPQEYGDVWVDVDDGECLRVGDVLTHKSYNTHAAMYMGYNPDNGYHQIAETTGSTIGVTNLPGTKDIGPTLTMSQLQQTTKWYECSRLRAGVLPEGFEGPEYVEWPSQFVTGRNP